MPTAAAAVQGQSGDTGAVKRLEREVVLRADDPGLSAGAGAAGAAQAVRGRPQAHDDPAELLQGILRQVLRARHAAPQHQPPPQPRDDQQQPRAAGLQEVRRGRGTSDPNPLLCPG